MTAVGSQGSGGLAETEEETICLLGLCNKAYNRSSNSRNVFSYSSGSCKSESCPYHPKALRGKPPHASLQFLVVAGCPGATVMSHAVPPAYRFVSVFPGGGLAVGSMSLFSYKDFLNVISSTPIQNDLIST